MESNEKKVENGKIKWNQDTIYALGLYKSLASLLGFWPTTKRKSSRYRVGFISIVQLSLVIIFVNDLIVYGNCGTGTELVDALSLITSSLLAVVKVFVPWLQHDRLRHIINSTIEDWSFVVDKKARQLMLKYAYLGRLVLIVQMFGAYMTIFPLILARLPGLIETSSDVIENNTLLLRDIPIGPRCWVSLVMPFHLYLAYYIFVCFHLLILATAYLGGDVFIFGIAMHVCGQFQLLYDSLDGIDGSENYIEQRMIVSKFGKRHDHLLKIANQFEDACNLIILCEVTANTFLICISGIMLLWGLKVVDGETILAMIVRILVMCLQLFMYSYIGENLSRQAEKLQNAIYNCPWYKMFPSIVRDMQFIMMRNNHMFHLTAGKIYVMNISNFKDLIKSMFSYFSILRLMFEA